jgi:hypothetical protein
MLTCLIEDSETFQWKGVYYEETKRELKRIQFILEPPTDGGGLKDFYHNWTNSILQQLKRNFWKIGHLNCRCIVPNFNSD